MIQRRHEDLKKNTHHQVPGHGRMKVAFIFETTLFEESIYFNLYLINLIK